MWAAKKLTKKQKDTPLDFLQSRFSKPVEEKTEAEYTKKKKKKNGRQNVSAPEVDKSKF